MKKEIVTITNPADKTVKQAIIELTAAIAKNFFFNCDVNFTSTIVPLNVKTSNEMPCFFVIEHNAKDDSFSLYDNVRDEYILIHRSATIKNCKIAAKKIFICTMYENLNFNIKSLDFEITMTPDSKF